MPTCRSRWPARLMQTALRRMRAVRMGGDEERVVAGRDSECMQFQAALQRRRTSQAALANPDFQAALRDQAAPGRGASDCCSPRHHGSPGFVPGGPPSGTAGRRDVRSPFRPTGGPSLRDATGPVRWPEPMSHRCAGLLLALVAAPSAAQLARVETGQLTLIYFEFTESYLVPHAVAVLPQLAGVPAEDVRVRPEGTGLRVLMRTSRTPPTPARR